MLNNLLMRATCCGGVALLPPEFDHFAPSGAACFDFTGLRRIMHAKGREPLPLTPEAHKSCAANVSTDSKRWWASSMLRETQESCAASSHLRALVRLTASMYAGFAVPGHVFGGQTCAAEDAPTLAMHIRSGEIFTNWRDGKHEHTHAGFQHDPFSRGQPPLAFYLAAMAHHRTLIAKERPTENATRTRAMVVTAPDQANPVVAPLLGRGSSGTTGDGIGAGIPVSISSSESFEQDLTQLLCARSLAMSDSSLNPMLLSSPNLREVFFFSHAGCDDFRAACREQRLGAAPPRRYWCVAGNGVYSVANQWLNDDRQRQEMLVYRVHAPVQVNSTPFGCVR